MPLVADLIWVCVWDIVWDIVDDVGVRSDVIFHFGKGVSSMGAEQNSHEIFFAFMFQVMRAKVVVSKLSVGQNFDITSLEEDDPA